MIAVFRINKFAKLTIAGVIILITLLAVYGFWFIFSQAREAEINRSNSMQVAKKIEIDGESTEKFLPALTIPAPIPDFFTEYRLERDKIRSERTDLLRDILKNAKTTESKEQAQHAILQMTLTKQMESEMENLVKSKGFSDALIFIGENSVSAIVKASSLSPEEVSRVADVISRISGAKAENIAVSAKP